MSHGYAHAWWAGFRSWPVTLYPFWRGKKYRKAWDNGRRARKYR